MVIILFSRQTKEVKTPGGEDTDQSEAKAGNSSENASELLPPQLPRTEIIKQRRRKISVAKKRLNY
jgi:hypothetical protein